MTHAFRLALGAGLLLYGLGVMVLFFRFRLRRWVAAQAMAFGELGLMWLVSDFFSGAARLAVMSVFGIASAFSSFLMLKSIKQEYPSPQG